MTTKTQLKAIIGNGGGNLLDGNVTTFKSGYSVSIYDGRIFDLKKTKLNEIIDYIDNHFKGTCGLWIDNNQLYIDYSINILSLEIAMNVARANRQLAIYDCTNNVSIYLEKE